MFGFVRYPKKYDEENLLRMLNNVWIDSYKLRVFIPKFRREPISRKSSHVQPFLANQGLIKESVSFADALRGIQNQSEKVTTQVNKNLMEKEGIDTIIPITLHFETSEEKRKWALESFTGCLKQGFLWEEHGEELLGECGSMIKIRSLGGNSILLQSIGDKSAKELLDDFDEWVAFWFEWVRSWKVIDVSSTRAVWTNWYGIPIHAWTTDFFTLIIA